MLNLLHQLCSLDAVSGDERSVSKFSEDFLSKYAKVKVRYDNSIIATTGNENADTHILFDAHIDQIGMIVTSIDDRGFIRIAACGGIDVRTLPGADVKILGDKTIDGIICCIPPHLSDGSGNKFAGIKNLYVDTGMNKKDVQKYINMGDRVSLQGRFKSLLGKRIASKSTDDRAGVAVLLSLAQRLSNQSINSRITILLSCQEEIGTRGAKVSAFEINPDEAIAVDVSFAKQTGVEEGYVQCELGKGPMICFCPSLSRDISNSLVNLSKKNSIPFQKEVSVWGTSGTNADAISIARGGVKCGVVSIPQRYMHTAVEVIDEDDLINTVNLLECYAKNGGAGI